MITAKLLCEFVTNPFGDERRARELLSEIEGRDLSDAELERGQFSFQIVFYFVALLAIEANIADPSVRAAFLSRLHDWIRRFYARSAARAAFSKPIGSEGDLADAARPQTSGSERVGSDGSPPAPATSLFDLIGLPRLLEYRDAIEGSNVGDSFYILAQRVLFHYSARKHHSVVVATIADLLSVNYNIASEIVISGLAVIDTRQSGAESCPPPLLLGPGMPDLTDRQPSKAYSAGRYLLLLFEDIVPIGRNSRLSFKYVLALCDKRDRMPVCFVTLENSSSLANVLCVFERGGSHSNYGLLQGYNLLQEFVGKGVVLLGDRFELGEIEEHSAARASSAAPVTDTVRFLRAV